MACPATVYTHSCNNNQLVVLRFRILPRHRSPCCGPRPRGGSRRCSGAGGGASPWWASTSCCCHLRGRRRSSSSSSSNKHKSRRGIGATADPPWCGGLPPAAAASGPTAGAGPHSSKNCVTVSRCRHEGEGKQQQGLKPTLAVVGFHQLLLPPAAQQEQEQ